ncbi:ice-binding family protein [Acidithrix sp. C25]|uniref:ice-binding family protein n=1 Tax=Acidithrix sp. C25 TaxID=1671482 RepID=UPI00191BB0F1|nr:ice-binding family protein [Acidithrix sp. C25]CAG4928566.1 unnamed protein product [Acidithrix sp. C25]
MSTSPLAPNGSSSPVNFWKVRGLNRQTRRLPHRHAKLTALGVSILGFAVFTASTSSPAFAATALNLGSATSYAVVAGSTITNTGSSVISGDIGLSPGTSITGFPPGTDTGTTNANNSASLAAQTAATAAYGIAASQSATTVAAGTLGGVTFTPGAYNNSTLNLTGTITLNAGNNPNAVFIFQSGSTLTTASSSNVVLENGAQACNVFWQVGSSATLGTTTNFAGTILALTSVTLNTGATVNGRIFAQTGGVTLESNSITIPTCSTAPTTTTTSSTTTSSTTSTVAASTTTTPATVTTTTPATATTITPIAAHASGVIPVGAPATGKGGTAGNSPMQLGIIGFGAIIIALGAAGFALRSRHQHG